MVPALLTGPRVEAAKLNQKVSLGLRLDKREVLGKSSGGRRAGMKEGVAPGGRIVCVVH